MDFAGLLATADRAVQRTLGSPVTYATEGGETAQVLGIFDAAFLRVDAGTAGVVSSGPQVFFLVEDLRAAFGPEYDPDLDQPELLIGNTAYTVKEVQKDGQSGVIFLLNRA